MQEDVLAFACALTAEGWRERVAVEIRDGMVVALRDARQGEALIKGAALPGLPNLHSHTFQRGFAGLAERRGSGADHFWTWREAMYRFALTLSPDDAEAFAAMAFVEMLESGFTSVAEFHYLHHAPDGRAYANPAEMGERIVAAAARCGIALTLLPVFYAHAGFGGASPTPEQRRFVCDPALYARLHESAAAAVKRLPHGRMGIAPHSLRAATGGEIAALLHQHREGPVHIHVAEQMKEVEDCLAATGARPVQWLLDTFPVDARWCCIHATHMTEEETRRLARSGAVAGLCPITESNLGDGIFPGLVHAEAQGAWGVGSDSNVCVSAPQELRTYDYSQRLVACARNPLAPPNASSGRTLFDKALAGGTQALGLPRAGFEPGCRADIVVPATAHPALVAGSGDALIDSWLFAAATPVVRDVFAAGMHVVADGRHHARDSVAVAFARTVARLSA